MAVESKLSILTTEKKEELKNDIVRNGGKVLDSDFKSLEVYLGMNPLEEGATANLKGSGENN